IPSSIDSMNPLIIHVPLHYTRYTYVSRIKDSNRLKLLDISSNYAVFHIPKTYHNILFLNTKSEIFSPPISLPISDQFELELFKFLDPTTAVTVLRSTLDYGRRVAILRASNTQWDSVRLLTMMAREWEHNQELEILIEFDRLPFYIVETHHDSVYNPQFPDFNDPLHTFYRVNLHEESTFIRQINCKTDDWSGCTLLSSFFPDSKRILGVKTLFDFESRDGQSSTIGDYYLDHPEHRISQMRLLVYSVDLVTQLIDRKEVQIQFPPDLHACTEETVVEIIGNELVFSQPGGCIMYNIDDNSFTKYTTKESILEYKVKSSMEGRVLEGTVDLPDRSYFFRGYLKTVPSLREIAQSNVQKYRLKSIDDLALCNTHEYIRSFYC
ncbi:hypothetical protein PFISCL1PPCAC_19555, partial [Pristionchus fissidentatus]